MLDKIDLKDKVSIEDIVVSHSYEMMALINILEQKGILSRSELVKEIQALRDFDD